MIDSIVEKFLASKRLGWGKGGHKDIAPLLPLLIMDVAYEIFCKHIKPVECKREMKMYKNEWLKCYRSFNLEYFSLYNAEEQDYIVDIMDKFVKWIDRHLLICSIQISNQLKFETKERQDVLCATLMISILAQSARVIYESIFEKAGVQFSHRILARLDELIIKWQELYYGKDKPNVRIDDDKQVSLAIDILCKQQVYFINECKIC